MSGERRWWGRRVRESKSRLGSEEEHIALPLNMTLCVCTCWHMCAKGDIKARIELGLRRPTACTFGGKDLGDLFVTTRQALGCGQVWKARCGWMCVCVCVCVWCIYTDSVCVYK